MARNAEWLHVHRFPQEAENSTISNQTHMVFAIGGVIVQLGLIFWLLYTFGN